VHPDDHSPVRPRRWQARATAGGLAGILTILAVVGCAGTGSSPGASAGPTVSAQQQARAVWLDYARCARTHGAPGFPDPHLDSQGRASFGNRPQAKQEMETSQVKTACGHILDRLPASARGRPPVTAAQMRQLLAFARCMRAHGQPGFPGPLPDGTFPRTGPYQGQLNHAAVLACRQLLPASSGGKP
jgi:hypothetical protein